MTSVSGSDGCLGWQEDFGYDANGNQTSRYAVGGTGSTVSWYSYNLPNTINLGGSASQFFYMPNRARWKQVANYGGATETTIYVGGILEKLTRGSVTEYRHRIPAGSSSTAVYVQRSSGSSSTYYTTSDHLGSSTVTMDGSGASLVNLSFGAYGKRRGAAWNDVPSSTDWDQITITGRDGFTGHEHLDNVGAIHMNGRVYDPQLGRFMSADPLYVGDLANPQSLNPYGYVRNRPLSATDPSGFIDEIVVTTTALCRWNFICYQDWADFLEGRFGGDPPPLPDFGGDGEAPVEDDDEDSEGEIEDGEPEQTDDSTEEQSLYCKTLAAIGASGGVQAIGAVPGFAGFVGVDLTINPFNLQVSLTFYGGAGANVLPAPGLALTYGPGASWGQQGSGPASGTAGLALLGNGAGGTVSLFSSDSGDSGSVSGGRGGGGFVLGAAAIAGEYDSFTYTNAGVCP